MDAWKTESNRLRLHRSILANKLSIPSNEATRASLQKQLDRVNRQNAMHIHAALPKPEPWESGLALRDERTRFGKNWSANRKAQCRERLADLRHEQECKDLGIKPYRWKPLSDEAFAECKERVRAIIARYARTPACK